MTTRYEITLAVDHHEGDEFVAWLNERGHIASVGNDTGNHLSGADENEDPREILRALWEQYCEGY